MFPKRPGLIYTHRCLREQPSCPMTLMEMMNVELPARLLPFACRRRSGAHELITSTPLPSETARTDQRVTQVERM